LKENKTYISKSDFHEGRQYAKINQHIDTCLKLIENLILLNTQYRIEVENKLQVDNYIIDYRVDQFGYYHNTLKSIYYSCYSLKNIYEVSTYMNFRKIDNTIGDTLNNQRSYTTFNAIVKLSSIFEYTRKVYEKNITKGPYFKKLKEKYSDKVDSLDLLNSFRNTIHSNGKWSPRNEKDKLEYHLREGKQIIKPGDTFKYDHWKLYMMIKDCLELSKSMALENEAIRLRDTRLVVNGQKVAVLKTDLTQDDWDNIFKEKTNA